MPASVRERFRADYRNPSLEFQFLASEVYPLRFYRLSGFAATLSFPPDRIEPTMLVPALKRRLRETTFTEKYVIFSGIRTTTSRGGQTL